MQKTALITGANSGIGRETALELSKKGYSVILLCRNKERGEAALNHINTESGRDDAELMICDLGDMSDIRRVCGEFNSRQGRLDILINNAGTLNLSRQETKDGLEMEFGVCHIGHFLLTNLLLGHMHNGSRIVVIGSVAHKAGRIDFEDLGMQKGYSAAKAYSRAKLCNMLFTKELSRRLEGTGITVNCVHPGAVASNIGARRKEGKTDISNLRKIAGKALGPIIKTPGQAAASVAYVATSETCAGISGAYFAGSKIAKPSAKAEDIALATKLWEVSVQITGLN